ncbi:MAG: hypothetical protein ACI4SG_06260 [Oligosphaeraceae bacterium]
MAKKSLLFLCAVLAALTLQADITLNNVAVPQALALVQANQKAIKGTLAETLQKEELAQKANDEKGQALSQIEALIPPEIKDNLQLAIAVAADVDAISFSPEDAQKARFVAGLHCEATPLKSVFDMLSMIPMVKPELSTVLAIEPAQFSGYNGYKVKVVLEDNSSQNLELAISKSGKTILIASEGLLNRAITSPAPMPATLQAARRDFAGDIFALTIALPPELQALIENLVTDSSFDADTKNALKTIQGAALRFQGRADSLDMIFQADLASAEQAVLLKNNCLDNQLVPMAQGLLPTFLPGASFPQTIAAIQNGATLGLRCAFTRGDLELLKGLAEETLPAMLEQGE